MMPATNELSSSISVRFLFLFVLICYPPSSLSSVKAEELQQQINADGDDVDDETVSLFPALPLAPVDSDGVLCRRDSRLFHTHLKNGSLWAYKMYDSSAKSVSGILHGSSFQLGHYDECLNVNGPFPIKYCLVNLKGNQPETEATKRRDPYSLHYDAMESVYHRIYPTIDQSQQSRDTARLAWCVPASCSVADLNRSLRSHLRSINNRTSNNLTYDATIWQETCQTTTTASPDVTGVTDDSGVRRFEFEWQDVLFCCVVAILVVLVAAGTFCDVREFSDRSISQQLDSGKRDAERTPRRSLIVRLLHGFSARKNFNDLSKADDAANPALSVLYGLRTVAIFMIIMDHRFGTYLTNPMLNFDFVEKEYRSVASWFIFHGDLFVDTFFVLSGILVTYGLLTQFDKRFIHPGYIILLRYIRLTPLFAFSMFYTATIYIHTGSGPFWRVAVEPEVMFCRKNWWLNMIYLSNYANTDEMCMVHSWYLPCDFHYFIVGIFVVLLIKRNKRLGLAILTCLLVVSVGVPFALTVAYRRPALLHFFPKFLLAPRSHPDFRLVYIKSHTRASTYFIGMFAGYIYYKVKARGDTLLIKKFYSHLITLVSFLLLFGGMASGAIFYDPYHVYEPYVAASYAAFHRPAWGLGTIGLLAVASYGHASVLRKVLAWRPWIPLSKLVYGAYLMHMSFQIRQVGVTRSPKHFDYFDIYCLGLGDVCLSFIVALALYILVEAPVRKCFRELLMPASSTSSSNGRTARKRSQVMPEINGRNDQQQQQSSANESRL